jgi:ribose transport system permease protein
LVLGLLTGAACGLANGFLAAKLKLHPIIMTLATSTIFTGLIYVVSEGNPVVNIPNIMLEPGAGTIDGFPGSALIMFGVVAVMQVLLTRTLFGLHVRQVGGNRAAARVTGVNVQRVWVGAFVISGLLAALGGIIELGQVGNAVPEIGSTLLFPIISATIVGGTLLTGGEGSMVGTLLGAAVLAVINNALVILAVNIYLQDVVQGTLVVVALVVDQIRRGNLTLQTLLRREL